MAKITIIHPGPRSLEQKLGITRKIARQLLEETVDALKDAPGEFTLYLATHGAQLVKGNMGRNIICETVFIQSAPQIQNMKIMTPEEAIEHWRITIEAPTRYITRSIQEEQNETTQNATGQAALFPL